MIWIKTVFPHWTYSYKKEKRAMLYFFYKKFKILGGNVNKQQK